jgi:hypothetical protein
MRRMSWILPAALLLFSRLVELPFPASVVRRPISRSRLLVEAFGITRAVIALAWLGWIALWPLEQCR